MINSSKHRRKYRDNFNLFFFGIVMNNQKIKKKTDTIRLKETYRGVI